MGVNIVCMLSYYFFCSKINLYAYVFFCIKLNLFSYHREPNFFSQIMMYKQLHNIFFCDFNTNLIHTHITLTNNIQYFRSHITYTICYIFPSYMFYTSIHLYKLFFINIHRILFPNNNTYALDYFNSTV